MKTAKENQDSVDNSVVVRCQRMSSDIPLPTYALPGSSGLDLMASESLTLLPGDWAAVPTGLKIALPEGYEGQVRPRSGHALRWGVTVLNSPGTIDAAYRGEIQVILINLGKAPFVIDKGQRIAQLVVASVTSVCLTEVTFLDGTERGDKGFGSTGV